ncbi:MAG: 2-oxoacid:ferredoxin oxidoreductase subunit beta [Thermoplasmata archaeon]
MAQAYDLTIKEFNVHEETWCPGCGDFGVNGALKRAMVNLELRPEQIALITGIGCSSKISDYFKAYTFHTIHGRPLPVASAVKIANPDLNVIVATGDGDGYAIGMGHFIHAIRRNVNITMIVMNNQVYGLTKGQFSPTAARGYKSGTSPDGSEEDPIDGAALALAAGATFVARSFSGDMKGSIATFEAAIQHPGFSVVDDLSPCVTFNKVNTYAWYRQNIRKLEEEGYEPTDRMRALDLLLNSEKIPVGILYQDASPPESYEERVLADPKRAPVAENLDPKAWPYERLMDEFR